MINAALWSVHGSDQIIDLLAVDKEDNDDNVNIDDDEDRNVKILAQSSITGCSASNLHIE